MEEKLREVVAKIAETSPTFSSSVNIRDDLNVDSVRIFEMVFEIERTFNVVMPEEKLADVATFDDLLSVVQSLQARA